MKRIVISSSSSILSPFGQAFGAITGSVSVPGAGADRSPVGFYRRARGDTTWTFIGSVITSGSGFSFTIPAGLSIGHYEYIATSGDAVSQIITQEVSAGTSSRTVVSSAQAVGNVPTGFSSDMLAALNCVVPALSETASSEANGTVLAAAVAEARAAGGYVKLPSGRFPMRCALTTGCIIEWSPTTVFLQEPNEACLDIDLSASAEGPFTITAFTLSENAASSGASSNKFHRLTMDNADAAVFDVGDAIMVCSRDARAYYTGDTNYAGEMTFVASTETGYVYLARQLYLEGVGTLYDTTPVAYKLSDDVVRLIRPQTEVNGDPYATGETGSWPGAIQIKAAKAPVLEDVRINSAWGIGVYLKSCAAPRITVDEIKDCPGDPANSRYGYGILFRGACCDGIVQGGQINRTRHAFTTDCREASSWVVGNIWDHGDCTNNTVIGVTSIGNQAPPFDTHENSIATQFIGCTAIGAHYSPLGITAATGNGFNLRGPWDAVIDCRAVDCEGGVNVAATGLIHEIVGENVIDGFQFIGEATNNLAGYGITVSGNASETTPQRVSVRNLRPGKGSRAAIIEANFTGRVAFEHCTFRGFVDTQLRVQGSCTVDVFASLFDMTEGGASELIISVDNSNTVALNLANVAVRSRASSSVTVLVTTASGATSNIRHYGCVELNAAALSGGISGGAGTNSETAITALA